MRFKRVIACICIFSLGICYVDTLQGQQSQQFRTANRFMNQQQYERAYQIYTSLLEQNPEKQNVYERAVECLINLKRYGEAIELTRNRIDQRHSIRETRIQLGELYHMQGDTTRAYETWNKTLKQHSEQLQTYLKIARSMKERSEYERAIKIYQRAQKKFNNDQLFANELAYTYQMGGKYEQAIRQYLKLIKQNPQRTDFVKRSLMRFKDDYLYEVAIVEFDEVLSEMTVKHDAYRPMQKLYQWLLMEMNLYERALADARNYERQTGSNTFAVFNLGNRLLSIQEYQLAEKAFKHYQNSSESSIRRRSMEKLGDVYLQWADFQSDYNLVKTAQRDSLYQKAYQTYTTLINENSGYQQADRVLMKQAELALDHLKNVEKAESYLELMQNSDQADKARVHYIDGRIKLYQSNFDRARIAFTRTKNLSKQDRLTQKSRYYLALTDFYAGDFEYAGLQLKTLEKQSTSYYANDAVELRVWIQDGMQKDSATTELHDFANAIHLLEHGQLKSAARQLDSWLSTDSSNPLIDDAILALARHSTTSIVPTIYTLIDQYVSNGKSSPLKERLLWERARMGEQIVTDNLQAQFSSSDQDSGLTREELFFPGDEQELSTPPENLQEVQELYEKILLEYPHGFYAAYARERIKKLQKTQT